LTGYLEQANDWHLSRSARQQPGLRTAGTTIRGEFPVAIHSQNSNPMRMRQSANTTATRSQMGVNPARQVQPRLGILDFNPIQYHTPLYKLITSRGRIDLDVLFISDHGYRLALDSEFGCQVAWDIDLLSGYNYRFLRTGPGSKHKVSHMTAALIQWIRGHDAIVIHGYSNPWMLTAMSICRTRRIPYLLRGDAIPAGHSTGIRRYSRNIVARIAVSASAGGLAIGQLNEIFYRKYGAPRVIFAPYSVDDTRFSSEPQIARSALLARWELTPDRPIIMYCGKLYPGKRPLDLTAAIKLLPHSVTTFFVGDGVLAEDIRTSLSPTSGTVTGFVNQSELPSYYHAADILVLPSEVENWGLVINEAMAAGTLPVVSDRVGAAPDLVNGIGEVYPCGDIPGLAASLGRALIRIKEPGIRDHVKQHVARYSLHHTAIGFEEATLAVQKRVQICK
jgi:glycosyltransferase involved in cell wall biosynthesis